MDSLPKRIVWKRESPLADPYEATTTISLPTRGLPENPLVILLTRGVFMHVESPPVGDLRQAMADSLNAICVESNCLATTLFNTPSPLQNNGFSTKSLTALAGKSCKPNMNLKEFLTLCKRESIHQEQHASFKELPKGLKHLFSLQDFVIFAGFVKALELAPSPNGHARAPVPDRIQLLGKNYLYTVDSPFNGGEKSLRQANKGRLTGI